MIHRSKIAASVYIGLLAFSSGCTVENTQSGKVPDVEVDVDAGRWPKFNVKWADVDVGTKTTTVTVPKLEWTRKEVQVQVPYIDINAPGTTDREERTVSVELEVPSRGYDIDVREIRAAGDQLWIVSELKKTGATGGETTRISDQLVVNAPDDLTIRKVIVGDRPDGVYNQQYRFYPDMAALRKHLPEDGGRVIYEKQS